MKIDDRVYGEFEITEPVLVDLINSKAIQRLKGVSQLGIPQRIHHLKVFSRYDHSIGVMLLLRYLGASVEEQIAGLIHDVSHTAFSHVIDWVVGSAEVEDFQDNRFGVFLKKTDIFEILERHGFDYNEFLDIDRFGLLEREIPSLCADRIDYTLRESLVTFGWIENGLRFLEDLKVFDGKISFQNKEIAEDFANLLAECHRKDWDSYKSKARYVLLSNTLKIALKDGVIVMDDFDRIDEEVLSKLKNSKSEEILRLINLLEKGFSEKDVPPESIPKKKFRYVDPEVLVNGKIESLSNISDSYAESLNLQKVEAGQ